jgi:Holliday junction resolvase RusA-like endonuclease
MTRHITLTLPLPPGVNNLYANIPGRGRFKAKSYRTWIKAATASLWEQKPAGGFPFFADSFAIQISVPTGMRGDVDGRMKAPIDFLKTPAGIISDDKHTQSAIISRSSDVPPGLCKVTVYEVKV